MGGCPRLGAKSGMFIDMQTAWEGLEGLIAWQQGPLFSLLTHLAHLLCPLIFLFFFFFLSSLFASPFKAAWGIHWGLLSLRAVGEGGDLGGAFCLQTLCPHGLTPSFESWGQEGCSSQRRPG